MKRFKLRNKFLKTRNNTDKFNYNKQGNFYVSLIQKEKTKYFANLSIKDVTDNKVFGKLLNALTFNTFFTNIVTSLIIPKFKNCNPLSERIPQPTLRAIIKYTNHPGISAIKKNNRTCHQFFFSLVEKEDIIKELHKLNPKKIT